jgi:hypothetical protein
MFTRSFKLAPALSSDALLRVDSSQILLGFISSMGLRTFGSRISWNVYDILGWPHRQVLLNKMLIQAFHSW